MQKCGAFADYNVNTPFNDIVDGPASENYVERWTEKHRTLQYRWNKQLCFVTSG